MWYKTALQYNLFGTLNKGNKKSRTRFFADDEDENIPDEEDEFDDNLGEGTEGEGGGCNPRCVEQRFE